MKGSKVRQVIWLPPALFAKVCEEAARRGDVALNKVIVELLQEYFDRPERVVERPVERIIERPVEREVYICPFCYQRMSNLEALRLHIKGLHKEEVRR